MGLQDPDPSLFVRIRIWIRSRYFHHPAKNLGFYSIVL
jgi:hypothetical protein